MSSIKILRCKLFEQVELPAKLPDYFLCSISYGVTKEHQSKPTLLMDLIGPREGDELQICLWFALLGVISLYKRCGSAAGRRR